MKKSIRLFALGLYFSIPSISAQQAQTNWELSKAESGTKSYVARDYISLKPGFSYKAVGANTFTAKIDEYLLFPPNDATYGKPGGTPGSTTASGGVVGAIPGQFAVSPSGAATYSIPIEVPAGINGLQPNISLVYNSQGGNGIAGWGWNIGGVSMISRAPKNHYYDGEVGNIDWTKESPLMLDGQRLIKISDTEYRTENESFSKITAKNIQPWGPEEIEVQTKEGVTMTYGNISNEASYLPLTGFRTYVSGTQLVIVKSEELNNRQGWMLTKIKDKHGNSLSYYYSMKQGSGAAFNCSNHTLYSISYSNGQSTYARIQFEYKLRDDIINGYVNGIRRNNDGILDRISVFSNQSIKLKEYELKYDYDGMYSHLKEVQLKSQNEALNPISIQWGENDIILDDLKGMTIAQTPLYNEYINNGFVLDLLKVHSFGDINNDGYVDILVRMRLKKGSTYKYTYVLYKNTGSYFDFVYEGNWENHITSVFFLDSNEDGKDELYVFSKTTSGKTFWRGSRLNGFGYRNNEFGAIGVSRDLIPSVVFDELDGNYYGDTEYVIPGNHLGDGVVRLALFGPNNEFYGLTGLTRDGKKLALSSGDAFKGNAYSKVYITNINGNSKPEFLLLSGNVASFYEYSIGQKIDDASVQLKRIGINVDSSGRFKSNNLLYTGDFDGDGNTDLLIRHKSESKWAIWWSSGELLTQEYLSNAMNVYLDDPIHGTGGVLVMDIDNDGRSDIISGHPNWVYTSANSKSANDYKLEVLVSKGRGQGFELALGMVMSKEEMGSFATYGSIDNKKNYGILTRSSANNKIVVGCIPLYRDIKYNKIRSINDGVGQTLTLEYDRVNNIGLKRIVSGTVDESEVIFQIPENMIILSKAVSKYSDQSYTFSESIFHRSGKGFLGFSQTKVKENTTGTELLNTFKLNTDYYTLIPDKTETKVGSTVVSQTTYNYKLLKGLKPRQFITQLSSEEETNKLSNTTVIKSFSNYDNYGNPKTISTDWGGGISETQSLVYTTAGSWCDNRVKSISTTRTNPNGNETLSATYDYYDTGKLKTHTANPGKGKFQVNNSYEYDTFGNLTKETVNNNGDARSASRTYTPSGRFLKTETNNQLKETVTYNFNETTGTLTSTVTPSGTTKYTYDGFGRITGMEYPDKNRTTTARQWAGSSVPGAIYYVYEETSGSGPVKVWYDGQGRELRRDFYGLGGKETHIKTEYNSKGQLYRVSEPYTGSAPARWAVTYQYDNYGRKQSETTPLGVTTFAYSGLKTTVTTPSGKTETTLNSAGQVVTAMEDGKAVTFSYYPSGRVKSATPEGGAAVTFKYDLLGNRTEINDPDAGTITTRYNGFGELQEQSREIHSGQPAVKTTYAYDAATKLLKTVSVNGQATSYTYDSRNRLKSETISGVHTRTYEYDSYSRPVKLTENVAGKSFVRSTAYDAYGRVAKETFPSGYYVTNTYDNYGHHTSVTDSKSSKIWEAKEADAFGRLTKYNQGGRTTTMVYDPETGLPSSIVASGIINMSYIYDGEGQLKSRKDGKGQMEVFTYDGMNRLGGWTLTRTGAAPQNYSMTYDPNTGGIQNKPNVSYSMNYGGNDGPPRALTSVGGMPQELKAHTPQTIEYNDFNKVTRITQEDKIYNLTYGTHRQRIKSVLSAAGSTKQTKYYLGNYEEEVDASGNIRKLHYIYGGNTLAAIMEHKSGKEHLYYTYTDYQGNLMEVTDATGKVKESYAYDPWGLRKDPENWSLTDTRTSFLFSRGYTMHEHLDDFGLINMNGRMYDPLMAQFLSPDPYIQAPGSWMNYNRYAYCYNNPLMYTDPDGEWIIGAMIIGAFINTAIQGATGNLQSGEDFFLSMGIGALSGAAGYGAGAFVGGALSTATTFGGAVTNGAITGAAGGFAGGFVGGAGNAWAGGASFAEGFGAGISGCISGAIGGVIIGGASGGYKHLKLKSKVNAIMAESSLKTDSDGSLTPSTETLKEFSDKFFGEFKYLENVNNIYKEGYVEKISSKYDAFTEPKIIKGKYNVYYAKAAFNSPYRLYLTMGHEYIHVAHLSIYGSNWNRKLSEYAAYRWNYQVSKDEYFNKMAHKYINPDTFPGKILNAYTDVYRYGISLNLPISLY